MRFKNEDKQGFVSIVVAALIMIILSLITIGFTRLMQREQRQAIDRQLTRQALYAAESGINDVIESIRNGDLTEIEKMDCDVNDLPNDGVISDNGSIAYTCAMYDKTPGELLFSMSTSESKVTEMLTETGNNFDSITVNWAQEEGLNNVTSLPACGSAAATFPGAIAGNRVPLLRMDITNISTLSRDALINATDYLYLVPCLGSATSSYAFLSGGQGKVIQVGCIDGQTYPCSLTITGISGSNSYAARLKSVYDTAIVSIVGKEQVGGGATDDVEFDRAQTSIDVTARASDIVRRLRVAVPLGSAENPPEAVFQSFDGVCKLLSVDIESDPDRIIDGCN